METAKPEPMMGEFLCQAKLYTTEFRCRRCQFLWNIGNPKPPRCLTEAELRNDPVKPVINAMARASYGTGGKK